jgi:hypothetical protein
VTLHARFELFPKFFQRALNFPDFGEKLTVPVRDTLHQAGSTRQIAAQSGVMLFADMSQQLAGPGFGCCDVRRDVWVALARQQLFEYSIGVQASRTASFFQALVVATATIIQAELLEKTSAVRSLIDQLTQSWPVVYGCRIIFDDQLQRTGDTKAVAGNIGHNLSSTKIN